MAAAFVYSTKTLNDNWYEDRCQPPGGLTAVGDINNKKVRKYETDIAYIGERYDVLARVGRVSKRESYATPDDGFRETARTSSIDFAHPRSRKEFVLNAPSKARFITAETIPEVCSEERRPVPGPTRGFGGALDRHGDDHGLRCWNTSSGEAFGHRPNGTLRVSRSDPGLRPMASGVSTQHEEDRMTGMKVGNLCGEEFRDTGNPTNDTRTQRAWVYDAALGNIHHGGTKPKVRGVSDNCLSVPLGDGAMSKIRKDLADRKGKLFRVATHITKGRDKRPGVAFFKDDP